MTLNWPLTEVEQVILLAVMRLGREAYAVSIRREIEERTGVRFSRGTIYMTLGRLEKRGYLDSSFADPTPERGGKSKKYFRLRPEAVAALRQVRKSLVNMWEGLERRLEEA